MSVSMLASKPRLSYCTGVIIIIELIERMIGRVVALACFRKIRSLLSLRTIIVDGRILCVFSHQSIISFPLQNRLEVLRIEQRRERRETENKIKGSVNEVSVSQWGEKCPAM